MNEIERDAIEKAIKGFEHEMRSIKNSSARPYNREKQERKIERETLAVNLLRAEQARQDAKPLTCDGCDRPAYWCTGCKRRKDLPNHYQPKGEKA